MFGLWISPNVGPAAGCMFVLLQNAYAAVLIHSMMVLGGRAFGVGGEVMTVVSSSMRSHPCKKIPDR